MVKEFVKDHKKEIIIVGGSIVVIGGLIVAWKLKANHDSKKIEILATELARRFEQNECNEKIIKGLYDYINGATPAPALTDEEIEAMEAIVKRVTEEMIANGAQ